MLLSGEKRRQMPQQVEHAPAVLPHTFGEFSAPGWVSVETLYMTIIQVVEFFF